MILMPSLPARAGLCCIDAQVLVMVRLHPSPAGHRVATLPSLWSCGVAARVWWAAPQAFLKLAEWACFRGKGEGSLLKDDRSSVRYLYSFLLGDKSHSELTQLRKSYKEQTPCLPPIQET